MGGGRVCEMREGVEGEASVLAVRPAARWSGDQRGCVTGEWVGDTYRGSENTRERTLPDSRRSVHWKPVS